MARFSPIRALHTASPDTRLWVLAGLGAVLATFGVPAFVILTANVWQGYDPEGGGIAEVFTGAIWMMFVFWWGYAPGLYVAYVRWQGETLKTAGVWVLFGVFLYACFHAAIYRHVWIIVPFDSNPELPIPPVWWQVIRPFLISLPALALGYLAGALVVRRAVSR